MNDATPPATARSWRDEILEREEEARAAFLKADTATLGTLFADAFVVNSPLQKVLTRQQLFDALTAGRIRHVAYDLEIERIDRHGDVVVVMGHDRVIDPPDMTVSHRRFTNMWQLQSDVWRSIARHAHVVSREAPGAATSKG